jgi:NADPH-dependent 2,4-dienoyl-CoA reductase/sulfur reductase-like enzyme
MSKIVIIGVNHAGTAAVNTILDHYPGNEVVVFDANSNISFLGCGMALWIGGQIEGPEGLFYSSQEILAKKGAHVHMETTVSRIDFEKSIVYAMDKDGVKLEESYDKLILATGSQPIIPSIEGSDLENVQLVKRYQDAEAVIQKLQSDKIQRVAVVGAGYIGVELAEALKRNGREVTLIDCAPTCLYSYYDSPFSRLMEENLREHGVELAFNQAVTHIAGSNGQVKGIATTKGTFPCDMVILAMGFRPNAVLGANELALFPNGAYRVDKTQRTSRENVYAIGDCATVFDNAIGDVNYIALATNAVRSGIVAAHNACGTHLESEGVQGSNGISIWGFNMVSTGLTLEKALKHGFDAVATDYEDFQRPRFMEKNAMVHIRIIYDRQSRVILGAQMASDYDISMGIHMFSLAIQEKVTIDRLKLLDLFFLPHFNQPYNYITMAALHAE